MILVEGQCRSFGLLDSGGVEDKLGLLHGMFKVILGRRVEIDVMSRHADRVKGAKGLGPDDHLGHGGGLRVWLCEGVFAAGLASGRL